MPQMSRTRDYIRDQVDARIYVRNIPAEYNEDLLRGIIAQYGSATVVELLKSRLVNGTLVRGEQNALRGKSQVLCVSNVAGVLR